MHNTLNITILCKVVDNYGDIGFVYRLSRALTALDGDLKLRLVTDNLASFSQLAPAIKPDVPVQRYGEWTVYDWNAYETAYRDFTANPPRVILECFQCGRPGWLERLLFDSGMTDTVHIINIEYLTAEPYADDFHCLQSLTRSARVQKVNFMPGFTEKTGGLILDEPFMHYLSAKSSAVKALAAFVPDIVLHADSAAPAACSGPEEFRVLVFSYERDFTPVVRALSRFQAVRRTIRSSGKGDRLTDDAAGSGFTVHVFAAAGLSLQPFLNAWEREGRPFPVTRLPFLPQTVWDALFCVMSFSFVRGEDSLSRACLAGIPFVWYAYPQNEEYQLVKVQALLDRMKPFFSGEDFEVLNRYWLHYNTTADNGNVSGGGEEDLYELFRMYDTLYSGFEGFAAAVKNNGDLAEHLLLYMQQLKYY